jgi:hypothetical protein
MKIAQLVKSCAVAGLTVSLCGGASASTQFTLFGNASLQNGVVRASSTAQNAFGGVKITLPAGTTFADLTRLSTDYNLTDDGAQVGSPRFQIAVSTDADPEPEGNIFVYIGTPPNFDDPGTNTWQSTGNFIGSTDARYDISQLVAGGQVSTYADALAQLGAAVVTEVDLVVDGGFADADGEQTTLFRNIQVVGPDADDDGVPDDQDHCPDSVLGGTVDINGTAAGGDTGVPNTSVDRHGCSLQDLVNDALTNARNHGQFVSAIAHAADDFRRAGLITSQQANALKSAAAHSTVGNTTGNGHGHDDDEDDDSGNGKGKGKGKGNGNGNGKGKGHNK